VLLRQKARGKNGKSKRRGFAATSLLLFAFCLLPFAFSLSGCAKEPLYQQQSYVFGTLVDVTIYGESEERARQLSAHVLAEFDRLNSFLHAWKPSTLSRMNEMFARAPEQADVDPAIVPLLRDAARLSEQSGGLFNPGIGNLIRLWGFQNDEFKPVRPDPAEIAKLVAAHPRLSDLEIEGARFHSSNAALRVDLGGYAKGYALDVAADYLRAQGVKNALVNIGGNIIALGKHGDRPWQVGTQHPRKPGAIATLELRDGEAVGTSGDYQRYFELDGKRYCHIIDPRNGYPAQGTQAVTVLIPPGKGTGVLSDVASKPAFIVGKDGWRAAAQKMGVEQAMLIDERGDVYLTPAMKKRLVFLDPPPKLHESP
jgi:FAD:protein FMN transferase